jgi:ketosteroid isomerase-like protein
MKSMTLHQVVQAYFEADARNDGDALPQVFAPNAVVHDENMSHRGLPEIKEWWREAKAKYQHVTEPLEASEADGVMRVRARVSGNFPGSPAMLTFAFHLDGDRIVDLEIGS